MKADRPFLVNTGLIMLVMAWITSASGAAELVQSLDYFEQNIRPVLIERCYECHSAQTAKLKGGLRLDLRSALLQGGDSGKPTVIPGDAAQSLLLIAIQQSDKDLLMPPPKHGPKLSDDQIAAFVAWVNAGALMPDASESKRDPAMKPPSDASKSHWAFQLPKLPPIPRVKDASWSRTTIDQFILSALESTSLKPSPPADARTLIRRMTYDMTGLPPKASEVEAFTQEFSRNRDAAVSALVDRLLASPHYGERWARHWLDVARYSDTKGYVYGREERFFVHSWAYRDWVVRAFNDDLPYDRFLLLQIAADQLVPANSPDLAAMGFITGGRRFIGVTRDIIDDRIDAVTRGTMALTVQCARCHDHKYDPIPTADYYSLYGVFHNSTDALVRLQSTPAQDDEAFEAELQKRQARFDGMMQQRRAEAETRLRARVGDYLTAQLEMQKYPDEGFDQLLSADDLIPASVRRWRDFLQQNESADHPVMAPWTALSGVPQKDFQSEAATVLGSLKARMGSSLNPAVAHAFATPPGSMREVALRYGEVFTRVNDAWDALCREAGENETALPSGLKDSADEALRLFLYDPTSPTTVPDTGIVNNEWFFPTGVIEELWKMEGEVDRWLIRSKAAVPYARVIKDAEPEPNPNIFLRGNPATKGRAVPRQFLELLAGPGRKPFQHGSGRLELAQEIVSPQNPLTARVMVNRIWAAHFGEGLVTTPSDFGLRARPPSHPKLLDWLALRFIESGWSVKAIHRLILNSAVYQQRSEVCDQYSVVSKVGRTAATDYSSKLITDYSVALKRDPDNRLLWHFNRQRLDFEEMRDSLLAVTGGLDSRLGGKPVEMFESGNNRRSLYGLVDRQFLPPVFRAFDFANPDLHIPQRHETTVSQQALFFLNNPWVAERAKACLAELRPPSLPSNARATEAGLRSLYLDLFQREPTGGELQTASRFLASAEVTQPPPPPKPTITDWKYGWGEYDETAKRTKSFKALPHFTGDAWQGGEKWPDSKLGWAQLTAQGGHPGNDLKHACIRRWTAPADATITITGTMINEPEAGDGIRGFIVSSRLGELKSGEAHASKCDMSVDTVEVNAGDTLDFIVDIKKVLNSDQFLWAPVIKTTSDVVVGKDAQTVSIWDAAKEFAGPPEPYQPPLQPWEQLVQVLLMSNEFMFVD